MESNGGAARDKEVRASLLRWYRDHARPLPWRTTQDPYSIWVSEVMLQQTQVATVIPYYQRFLHVFPSCRSLAKARFRKVAQVWSGLGYYRRARLLHLGAKKVLRYFAGRFPEVYDQAREIPGVGHYTASAVLSIAYGAPFSVVDGNVARVVARLDAVRGNMAQAGFRRSVEDRLKLLISMRSPGNFNQALMELGQTVCLPRAPRCPACPLRRWCRAHKLGRAGDFPAPRPRRATECRYLAAAIIRKGDKVALAHGLDENLLNDLLNFPSAFGKTSEDARHRLRAKVALLFGSRIHVDGKLGAVRHRITFRSILVELYTVQLPRQLPEGPVSWLQLSCVKNAAVSQLAKKIGALLLDDHESMFPMRAALQAGFPGVGPIKRNTNVSSMQASGTGASTPR
jgi:A/G-specific adenine glycosylase